MVSRIDLGPDGGPYVEIDEDAGDLVIRVPNDTVDFDSNDLLNAVLQNATMDGGSLDGVSLASALDANNQDLNSVGTASVTALEAGTIDSPDIGPIVTQSNIGSLSLYSGDRVTVTAGSYQTVFDVQEPVDVLTGVVLQNRIGELRITWADDSTDTIPYAIDARGETNSGDEYSTLPIPDVSEVKKLEFENGTAGDADFGWRVVTS